MNIVVSALKIGSASDTATLLRANESDANDANNSATMESVVVDRSGEDSGGVSPLFLLLTMLGLWLRRSGRIGSA